MKDSCLPRRAGDGKGFHLWGKAWLLDQKPLSGRKWRGALGRAEGERLSHRRQPWDPGCHLQEEPAGPGFQLRSTQLQILFFCTIPLGLYEALSKLLNLSGTSISSTKRKSAYLPGKEWRGLAGRPVRC